MKNQIATYSFIVYSSIYLFLILFDRNDFACYMKPGLELFLIYIVYKHEKFPTKKILLSALCFSWIGDIILIFNTESKTTFMLGLSIFLITHIIYIVLFNKQSRAEKFKLNLIFLIGIGVVAIHLIAILSLLLPYLNDMKIPVVIYALTLSIMMLSAFKGSLDWKNNINMNVLIGAFAFAFSDSINAINIFYTDIDNAFFWQESGYLVAQFLITIGILSINKENQKQFL